MLNLTLMEIADQQLPEEEIIGGKNLIVKHQTAEQASVFFEKCRNIKYSFH